MDARNTSMLPGSEILGSRFHRVYSISKGVTLGLKFDPHQETRRPPRGQQRCLLRVSMRRPPDTCSIRAASKVRFLRAAPRFLETLRSLHCLRVRDAFRSFWARSVASPSVMCSYPEAARIRARRGSTARLVSLSHLATIVRPEAPLRCGRSTYDCRLPANG